MENVVGAWQERDGGVYRAKAKWLSLTRRHSHGTWLDGSEPFVTGIPKEVAHVSRWKRHAKSRSGPHGQTTNQAASMGEDTVLGWVRSGEIKKSAERNLPQAAMNVTDIGMLFDKAHMMYLPVQNEAKKRVQGRRPSSMILKRKGLNPSEGRHGKSVFENSQLCSLDI